MLFSSIEFIFIFLPISISAYALSVHILGHRAALTTLLVLSLVFYGFFEPYLVFVILGSIIFNYIAALLLIRAKQHSSVPNGKWHTKGKIMLCGFVIANLATLAWFKYANFLIDQYEYVTGKTVLNLDIVLPLAISFFTFQQIAYLVDIWKGKTEKHEILTYSLFVCFFPQLIAGPIVHHKDIVDQFKKKPKSRFGISGINLSVGLSIFFLGLFKKTVIADNLDQYTKGFDFAAAGGQISFIEAWTACITYTFQIYFDFSAYSDMATGLARIFGIILPVNFLSPYKASNISEFWRRWHITLSQFLRDYLYIPLGGNRKGAPRALANLMITMLLGGLWHGAGWTFVFWGFLHGLYLTLHRAWKNTTNITLPDFAARPITFLFVALAWVPFRAEDMQTTFSMFRAMAGIDSFTLPLIYEPAMQGADHMIKILGIQFVDRYFYFHGIDQVFVLFLLLGLVWFTPNVTEIFLSERPILRPEQKHTNPGFIQWAQNWRWAIVVALAAGVGISGSARIVEFIYFQF